MPVAAIAVSSAAEALHPGMTAAIDGAGGATLRAVAGLRVTAAGEGGLGATLTVAHARRPRLERAGSSPSLAFAEPDLGFAAAVIVALARGDAAAGADPVSLALAAMTARVAARDIAVLIGSPTGTGKEVLARAVHLQSPRRDAPFVAFNCAALPEEMLEALLFGHERGAFTGAGSNARGLFRAADRGTLLLDEIAELPLAL